MNASLELSAEQYSEIRADIRMLTEQIKNAIARIDEQSRIIENVRKVAVSFEGYVVKISHQQSTLDRLQQQIEKMSARKLDRYEKIWGFVVGALCTGIVGYFFMRLGLK